MALLRGDGIGTAVLSKIALDSFLIGTNIATDFMNLTLRFIQILKMFLDSPANQESMAGRSVRWDEVG